MFTSLSCTTPLYSSIDWSISSEISAVREISSKPRVFSISSDSIKNSRRLHMDMNSGFSSLELGIGEIVDCWLQASQSMMSHPGLMALQLMVIDVTQLTHLTDKIS